MPSQRILLCALLIVLAAPALPAAMGAEPEAANNWENEEHWASAGCTTLTVGHYASHNEKCHTCVDKTKGHGDPTRCHQCLRPHHGHLPEELVEVCLSCVPKAEHKRLGWACTQYCTHHGIINDKEQAEGCIDCLMAAKPTDKWGCHVCMEQVDKDMAARNDCYNCLKEGKQQYQCAYCGRVPNKPERDECFKCMADGTTSGRDCAKKFGVGEWVKAPAPAPKPQHSAVGPDHANHSQTN